MPKPINDLQRLLASMDPVVNDGTYVYASVDNVPDGLDYLAIFREAEGASLIIERSLAVRSGLVILFEAKWITLRVYSVLDAVGLTAAVSAALTEAGISCNIVAAAHHDHLFVPVNDAERALGVLKALSLRSRNS